MLFGFTLFESIETLIFLIALSGAVATEIAVLPALIIVGIGLITYFINHWDIIGSYHWIGDHQLTSLLCVLLYVFIGIVWSMLKWKIKLGDLAAAGKLLLTDCSSDNFSYQFKRKTGYDWPIRASKSKEHIVTWMMYWPLSIPLTILSDWFIRLWDNIYKFFQSVYQKMADSHMSALDNDLKVLSNAEAVAKMDAQTNIKSTTRYK